MKKMLTKIMTAIAGIAMVIGVGFAIAINRAIPNRADADTYILVKDVNDIASGDHIIIGNGRSRKQAENRHNNSAV